MKSEDRLNFRVFDNERNRLAYFNFYNWWTYQKDIGRYLDNGLDIMQCTGTKDKNGKLIYEGDIVYQEDIDYIGVIKFVQYAQMSKYESHVGFCVDWINDEYQTLRKDIGFWTQRRESIIIGNIYEKPELIEGK